MSDTLARWNRLPVPEAEEVILPCCGSRAWARRMVGCRPIAGPAMLLALSDETWRALSCDDWMEAWQSHPRIGQPGEQKTGGKNPDTRARVWSAREQSAVAQSQDSVRKDLVEANQAYESRFGRTFIVCATGKTAAEILNILRRRLHNDPATELAEAVEQQRQITHIRLQRWLAE